MSESDSDHHENEFLMATRERRSNAGNKMKKLLAQEVEEMQSKTESLNDDELDLLFKEDAEDEDFESGQSAESDVEVDDVEEQEVTEQVEDNDLLVSESDEEVSEQEDEDNENEIKRQESLQQKRKRKTKPPIIKRKAAKPVGVTSPAEAVKKKTTYEVLKAESLLVSDRRTSKRSHVVANKFEVYEKLSLAEEKRKIIQERLKKHKEKQDEKVLTQEDRLRMSLETEKFNVQSLDKYKEQEISKKQTRLAIQQRQKMKFKAGEPIISELTTSWIVTPVMEYEDKLYWDEQLKKREKKRKKYPRRQTKKKSPGPGTKDSKLKAQSKEGEAEVKQENQHGNENPEVTATNSTANDLINTKPDDVRPNNGAELEPSKTADDGKVQESVKADNSDKSDSVIKDNLNATGDVHNGPVNIENAPVDEKVADQAEEQKDQLMEKPNNKPEETSSATETTQPSTDIDLNKTDQQEEVATSPQTNVRSSQAVQEKAVAQESSTAQPEQSEASPEVKQENNTAEQAHVSFADTTCSPSNKQSSDESKTGQPNDSSAPELIDDNGTEEELVFEGPSQEVSRNFVTVYNFGSDSCNVDFKSSLFGSQWQASHNQRSMNVENICKITMPEDPIKSSEKSPIVPDLSFLSNFPVFGEYGKRVVYDVGLNTGKEMEIEIKTQPPTGVLFSNSVRKKCYITSKECQYFDPKNGVPYSDVEAYKVIQEVQNPLGDGTEDTPNPHYQWFGFGNGGVYLDALQRPAKGVPEGF